MSESLFEQFANDGANMGDLFLLDGTSVTFTEYGEEATTINALVEYLGVEESYDDHGVYKVGVAKITISTDDRTDPLPDTRDKFVIGSVKWPVRGIHSHDSASIIYDCITKDLRYIGSKKRKRN